jgi:hypothetical protein
MTVSRIIAWVRGSEAYKEPSPAGHACTAVHVVCDQTSKKARDCARDRYSGVKKSEASGKLILPVP